jgi:hypothetical protein
MIMEGRIEARIAEERWYRRLELKLLVDRKSLPEHEAQIVNALFVRANFTDADLIQRDRQSEGLYVTGITRTALSMLVPRTNPRRADPEPARTSFTPARIGRILLLGSLVLWVVTFVIFWIVCPNGWVTSGMSLVVAVGVGVALHRTARFSELVVGHWRPAIWALASIGFAAWVSTSPLLGWLDWSARWSRFLAILLTALTAIGMVGMLAAGTPKLTKEDVILRKRLASIRRYFKAELRCRQPRIRQERLPYVDAFGLGRQVDRWSKRVWTERPRRSGFVPVQLATAPGFQGVASSGPTLYWRSWSMTFEPGATGSEVIPMTGILRETSPEAAPSLRHHPRFDGHTPLQPPPEPVEP